MSIESQGTYSSCVTGEARLSASLSRGKKVKTDSATLAAGAPTSKAKKGAEKNVASGDDEVAKDR